MSDEQEIRVGSAILDCIVDFGLLLSPEDMKIGSDPTDPSPSKADRTFTKRRSTRACFTALQSDRELAMHARTFGAFAIALDMMEARQLGLVPTIYCYKPDGGGTGAVDGGFSFELLHKLRDLHGLASALAWIEARAKFPQCEGEIPLEHTLRRAGIELEPGDQSKSTIEMLSEMKARELDDFFPTKRPYGFVLADWIEIMISMFQLTEADGGKALDYFNQREWRIVQARSEGLECYPFDYAKLPVGVHQDNEALKARIDAARAGISSRLLGAQGSKPDLSDSALLFGVKDRPFFDFVRKVMCPIEARGECAATLTRTSTEFSESVVDLNGTSLAVFERVEEQ